MKRRLNILCVIVVLVLSYSVFETGYYFIVGVKAGVEAGIAAGERTMMGLIAYEIDAMKKVVAEKIRLFGSEGKAC